MMGGGSSCPFLLVRDQDKLVIANSRTKGKDQDKLSQSHSTKSFLKFQTFCPYCIFILYVRSVGLSQSKCQITGWLSQSICGIVKNLTSLLEGHSSTIPLYHTFRNMSRTFLNEYLYKIESFPLFSKRNDVLSLLSAADFVKNLTIWCTNE